MTVASRLRRWWGTADEPFPPAWRDLVARRLGAWDRLTAEQRSRLEALTARLVAEKRWEAARGLTLTDEIRVTIAAHAALLVLEIGYAAYDDISSIIVHASTIFLTGEQPGPIPGSRSDETVELIGEAHHKGPVLLSWDAALHQARHPEGGDNVIFHEFAHRLDMLDGLVDGTPIIPDGAARQRWIDVCTAEFHALRTRCSGRLAQRLCGEEPGGVLRGRHRGVLHSIRRAANPQAGPLPGPQRLLPPGPRGRVVTAPV